MTESILQLKHLFFAFPDKQVLNDLNYDLKRGDFFEHCWRKWGGKDHLNAVDLTRFETV